MLSRQVGLTRKIDYYKFYNSLTGKKDPAVEKEIGARALAELTKPLPPLNPTAANPARSRNLAAEYRATVMQSVIKNKLASPTFYDELLAKEPDADVLKSMALQAKNYTNQNRIRTLLAIVRSANANEGVEVAAWNEIKAMRLDPPSQERVSEDFIQAREARPAGRSTAGAQAPSNLPEDRRPPQRPRNIFEQLFGG